jgi:hypothetical protein
MIRKLERIKSVYVFEGELVYVPAIHPDTMATRSPP